MKNKQGVRNKWKGVAAVILVLTLEAAFCVGCGEDALPPPPPSHRGTVIISGGAV
jgi:hypothetical protein